LSVPTAIGFNINFYGTTTNSVFINTNGNVSLTSPLNFFTVGGPFQSIGTPLIAPYYANVDTTGGGQITYGQDVIGGHRAFGVTWTRVGFAAGHGAPNNTFQMLLIDRSDTGAGNFDIEFNYDQVLWDTADTQGGTNGIATGPLSKPAQIGFSAGSGAPGSFFILPGSGMANEFLDGTSTALILHTMMASTPGRYHFQIRGGHLNATLNQDVTNLTSVYQPFRYIFDRATQTYRGNVTVVNRLLQIVNTSVSEQALDEGVPFANGGIPTAPLTLVFNNLPPGVTLVNRTGVTASGAQYITTPNMVTLTRNSPRRIPVLFANPGRRWLSTFFRASFQVGVFVGPFDPTTA
jgi:hypothetical protein